MNWFVTMLSILLILNVALAFILIFLERKDPSATWAWLMVLLLVPYLGFVLYLVLGQNLSRQKIFDTKTVEDQLIGKVLLEQLSYMENNEIIFNDEEMVNYQDMIRMQLITDNSIFTQDNQVEIFTDGIEKFEALLDAINKAEDHIHMLYYIIKNDSLSKKIIEALAKKASEGVEVRLLYDALGGRTLTKRFFRDLTKAGGKVASFFPSRIPLINLRVNYRNHRKLAIIDGKIGFIGGFNIGNEYIGLNKKMGYWRDTHLRIKGSAVHMMQTRFFLDWHHAAKKKANYDIKYYPQIKTKGKTGIQIVSSGPDSEKEQIKHGYLKMINSARESIYIQTPYFVPDQSILEALRIALLSGVDVRLMIPNRPDHPFVYWATYSYIGELIDAGVKAYTYENGFLHAKTMVVDGKISSVGTANIDVRSFKLNFEVNAFIYDTETSVKLKEIFEEDLKFCHEITKEKYLNRSIIIKFKESISRLLSPVL
ncbi:cardiolipin synthetase 2 [Proteiniborus ethanoligenes]|uniref:Cardiolipin synthase n=1 Tax=Proteiniborus ethanoligenes TaxID=415015 RepID=A0A1H3MZR4_9FIRM|nr:cardiolipin synthase [Proteiniborus ethanoligenes]SDY81479.1 cardiolipin synthetase 2 [Proteiniborus ethanoligenes]